MVSRHSAGTVVKQDSAASRSLCRMPYNPAMTSSPAGSNSRTSAPADGIPQTVGWLSLPQMRFQSHYVWFVFFSALDIMLTWAILSRGGREVNPIADEVIKMWGLNGAIMFKFSITVFVVIVCEIVARTRYPAAYGLAIVAVVISSIPVPRSCATRVWRNRRSLSTRESAECSSAFVRMISTYSSPAAR